MDDQQAPTDPSGWPEDSSSDAPARPHAANLYQVQARAWQEGYDAGRWAARRPGRKHAAEPLPVAETPGPEAAYAEGFNAALHEVANRETDPGGRRSAVIAAVVAALAFLSVAVLQAVPPVLQMLNEQPRPAEVQPPSFDGADGESVLRAKAAFAGEALPEGIAPPPALPSERLRRLIAQSADPNVAPDSTADALARLGQDLEAQLAALPGGAAAPATADETDNAELRNARADHQRLTQLMQHARWFETVYRAGSPDAIDPQAREELLARHGYFARIALSVGEPDSQRAARLGFTAGQVVAAIAAILAMVLAGLAIIAGVVVGLVMLVSGYFKRPAAFTPPGAGGSVYLEVFALFVLGFLTLITVTGLVQQATNQADWVLPTYLLCQWSLIGIPLFWPVLRGMTFRENLKRMGFIAPGGLLRTVARALPIYLVALPATIVVLVVCLIVMGVLSAALGHEIGPAENPIAEMMAGPPWVLLLLATLVVGWAPLCEEMVFRGALFRHLSAGWGCMLAALLSAVLFGFMHGNGPILVWPLIVLGLAFAFIRWRTGSIWGAIVTHALHNGTILVLVGCALVVFEVI